MQVIDEISGKRVSMNSCHLVVVQHLPGMLVFGYSKRTDTIVSILACVDGQIDSYLGDYELLKDVLVYSSNRGCYISIVDYPVDNFLVEQYQKGMGKFPYTFSRRYEAIESFNIFKGRQKVINLESFDITPYLHYTFGLEFETSMGYVPENLCFRDGLIPLRDGSISGLEYSTVVLEGNEGLSLLKQQIETLKKYTAFNKECSLHIHLGGFPLNPDAIYRAYLVCKSLEGEMENIVPPLTFKSGQYKENGKDYCMKLRTYRNFNQMYEHLVGRRFFGSFTQPHPLDLNREAKWRIPTRYYAVNFINLLCYNVNKTVEFRFLRPTYQFNKILLWLAIFNAILKYAEDVTNMQSYREISLGDVIRHVYPTEIANKVWSGVTRLRILVANQTSNGDYIGRDIEFEDELFRNYLI